MREEEGMQERREEEVKGNRKYKRGGGIKWEERRLKRRQE